MSLASDIGRAVPLTVVCVGTDRSTGDSLGPLVGTMLSRGNFRGTVLGDLEMPVHAENLESILPRLSAKTGLVMGVDACLGTRQEVGSVMVRAGPLRPGLGVKKKLTPIGDLYIAGVVNVGGFMEYMVLQNTRLSLVMKMAETIAAGIQKAESILDSLGAGAISKTSRTGEATPAAQATGGLDSPLLQAFARRH